MREISLTANLKPEQTIRIVASAARQLGYSVGFTGDWELTLKKGGLLSNLLAGPLAPPRDFRVVVRERSDKTVEVSISLNKPWWSGMVGLRRLRSQAQALADAVESAIRESGGKILERQTS